MLVFRSAISGEVFGTLEPNTSTIDANTLSRACGRNLLNAIVLLPDGDTIWLDGMSITYDHADDIILIIPPNKLCNSWVHENFGTRRWYKEFREFSHRARFALPDVPNVTDGYPQLYGAVEIAEIAPLILQMHCADCRDLYDDERKLPHWWRNRTGCYHSIVRRTGFSLNHVRHFVEQWEKANEDVLGMIEQHVMFSPLQCRTYFR